MDLSIINVGNGTRGVPAAIINPKMANALELLTRKVV